jgi:hypothetical protein
MQYRIIETKIGNEKRFYPQFKTFLFWKYYPVKRYYPSSEEAINWMCQDFIVKKWEKVVNIEEVELDYEDFERARR